MSDGLGLLERQVGTRDSKFFVVAIEGDNAERRYLEPLEKRYGVKMEVLPSNSFSSPQAVLGKLHEYRESKDLWPGDELWLMIDTDIWPRLLEVCQEATSVGYEVAVSNPCFELWLWLHFYDYDPDKVRNLKKAVSDATGGYDYSSPKTLAKWQGQIPEAIRRAKELPGTHLEPVPGVPGTTVYRLMERVIDNKNQNKN